MTVVADAEANPEQDPAASVPASEPAAPTGRAARRKAQEKAPAAPSTGVGARARRRNEAKARRWRMIAMSLTILATVCLGFVATMSFLGALRAHRDQVTSYDNFRYDLANGTAPVAQTDENGILLAPGTPVALIDIPALDVHQVVSEGTTSGILMSGPGHRRDTLLPGQAGVSVIYGRRAAYGGPFRDLGNLKPGDEITTTTGQSVSKFRVVDVRRAGAALPPAAQKGRLVLITADGRPWVPNGVIAVDADLVTDAQPANQRVITNATLSNAELPLQGDPAAWVSLLLWTQLLLIVAVAVAFAWARWGRWEAWLLGIPIALAVGIATASQAAQLLPNLM